MASEPQSEPDPSGHRGAPLQPAPEERSALGEGVPDNWLIDPAHHDLADHIDRIAGDVDLVTLLALGGYTGRDWDYFATELAKYGIAVLGAWMHNGKIFARSKERGFGLLGLDRPFTRDEIDELSGETIAKALHHFRIDVLMQNRWDSRRGATLRTYFIGQCLIRFSNVYKVWHRGEKRARHSAPTDDLDLIFDLLGASGENVADLVADRAVIEEALRQVKDPRVVAAIRLSARDHSHRDIAGLLGVTAKAVERMLGNERDRQRRRRRSA